VGYTIKIAREPAVTLDEWELAVRSKDDVRLQRQPTSITNPHTGEVISFRLVRGDAEVLLDGEWSPCFLWREGDPSEGWPSEAVFGAPRDFDEPGSRVRAIARELAKSLGAQLVGQEGEVYE
jgi:hypothetical protein